MENIIKKAIVIQNNGMKQLYDAILVTQKGIYTGSIKTINKGEQEFEEHSFIPRDQIKKIMIFNEHGKSKDIDL